MMLILYCNGAIDAVQMIMERLPRNPYMQNSIQIKVDRGLAHTFAMYPIYISKIRFIIALNICMYRYSFNMGSSPQCDIVDLITFLQKLPVLM